MEASHSLGKLRIGNETSENIGFLLTNKKGGYCSFYSTPSSRYQGLFYFDPESMKMFKFIENIEVRENQKIIGMRNGFYFFERNGMASESFIMPSDFNSLVYELEEQLEINVLLDCKDSYDNREWGRHYEVFEEDGCIVIKFTKRTDWREDQSEGMLEFELYLAAKGNGNGYTKNDQWLERNYSLDEKRDSMPFKRHVYNAMRLNGSIFVFSISKVKVEAIKECNYVFDNLKAIKIKERKNFLDMTGKKRIKDILKNDVISVDTKIAYVCALNSLKNLAVKDSCIFAGLPWFFQFWSRDTAVSLKALAQVEKDFANKIALDCMAQIGKDGRLPNLIGKHASVAKGNADAHGWLFLRCKDIADGASARNEHEKTVYEIESALEKSIAGLQKFHTKEGLEFNEKLETWMDTSFGWDERVGARLEIQALRLSMYKLIFRLSLNPKYRALENIMKNKVLEKFWNGNILADGAGDFMIRPNIFIAAYAYPGLLKKEEWTACLDNALKALWLEWGGLSTIDKGNPLFTASNTGEDSRSYHRGDSWFWINNLAALVMHKTDKDKFRKNIRKIIDASTEEILWKGCIGCHSELSSAKQLESNGCWSQAWSSAMFIEMVDEVFG